MAEYFLGVDNGGTVTKAAIIDQNGREIASASQSTPVLTPKKGYFERDMLNLWQITAGAIRRAIAQSGVQSGEIAGVGCTGHGKGLYLWGKNNSPAYNAIASTDHRAAEITERWHKDGTALRAREKTLQNVIECQPAPLLAWLKENEPEAYANIKWIFEAKDYIRFMLTGEAYAEETDYSGTSLMNLLTRDFDEELLRLWGLEEIKDCLPPLRHSFENCGRITAKAARASGLTEGTPVCGAMCDIDACAIAMDVSSPQKLCAITGTWSINEYISSVPVPADSSTLNSLFCIPGYYLIEESSPTSAGNLEWVIDNFFKMEKERAAAEGRSVYEYINAAVAGAPVTEIIFLPFLYGTNYPGSGGAQFAGITGESTAADILRAVYEGVAFSHLSHIEKLLLRREKPEAVRIAGGVVNSDIWLQIFADVINIPLEVVQTKELGALGCAMAAAVCAGKYKDYAHAAGHMVKVKKVIKPNEGMHHIYMKKYRRYKALAELSCRIN